MSVKEATGMMVKGSYAYNDLPPRYWKKYQYAAQCVGLVRSRTPKVGKLTAV